MSGVCRPGSVRFVLSHLSAARRTWFAHRWPRLDDQRAVRSVSRASAPGVGSSGLDVALRVGARQTPRARGLLRICVHPHRARYGMAPRGLRDFQAGACRSTGGSRSRLLAPAPRRLRQPVVRAPARSHRGPRGHATAATYSRGNPYDRCGRGPHAGSSWSPRGHLFESHRSPRLSSPCPCHRVSP